MAGSSSTGTLDLRTCLDLGFAVVNAAAEVRVTTTLFEFAVVRLMAVDDVRTEFGDSELEGVLFLLF